MLKHSSSSSGSNLLRLSCLLVAAAAFSGCELDTAFIDNYEDVIGADGKDCKDIQYIEVDDVRIECKTEEGAVCTQDDIEVTQDGEIIDASKYERYYISFSSDKCPSRIDCKQQKNGQNYCGGSTKCDPETCPDQIQYWVSGECVENLCRVNECKPGFKPSADKRSCAPDCHQGQHYDNAVQKCVDDDLENCGQTGNRCAAATGWEYGDCTLGKCNAETCETGYDRVLAETLILDEDGEAIEIFACRKGDCPPGQHSDQGVCKDDTIDDCGQAGYKCEENVTEWAGGRCENGICIVEACSTGFKPSTDARSCASDCNVGEPGEVGQHYDSAQQKCVEDDLDNCGQKGLVCASTSGWVSGQCLNNKCIAEECDASNGYTVVDGTCVAACIGNQVKCGGLCRDPMQDSDYCGATGTINSCKSVGTKCANGQVCVNGKCEQNTCGTNETLCSTASGKDCINVKSNKADNCGSCGYVCKDHAIPNATSNICAAGACQYECTTGYVNVGTGKTSNTIICINPKTDNNYCGATSPSARGKKCGAGEVCVDGSCAKNSCTNPAETLCSTTSGNTCINIKATDANNCGACGYQCSEHAIQNATSTTCNAGNCQYTCATGYVNVGTGSTAATIKCVDPKTDNQFCGATSASAKGQVCSTGKVCVDGSCATNSCTNSTETLCSTSSGNTCINIKSNNPDNCGACGYKCSEHAIQNATSTTCNAGNCQYTCATGYVNVGSGSTAATIKCVDPKTDNQFCGATSASAKGQVCSTGKVCIDGSCATNSCTNTSETLCSTSSGNTCINIKSNNANNCGACGYKCSEHAIQNATSTTCNAGNCQYTCATGYVNVGTGSTSATIKCIDPKTDNQFCGATSATAKGQVCSTGKVCINGSCAQNSCTNASETLCSTSSGNKCINLKSTDASNCGTCGYKCSEHAIQNATSTTCNAGNCQYTCATGYVNVGTGSTSATIKCVDPKTDNQFCGATSATTKGQNCTANNQTCLNGTCKSNPCNSSTCYYQGSTCQNNKTHCGVSCIDCTTANHAADGTCTSAGKCSITLCAKGYHLSGTSGSYTCVENTPTSCGPTNSTATVNCTSNGNATAGTCSADGTCVITACKAGFHLYNNTCISNTILCDNGYMDVPYNGTKIKSYCIQSADDFIKFVQAVNNGKKFPENFSGNAYVLTKDIDLGTQDKWPGVTNPNNHLTFAFFGNNHKISGKLTCANENCGLIGHTYDTLVDGVISAVDITTSYKYTGGIVGNLEWTMLTNSKFIGTINSKVGEAGGLVGRAESSATIKDCTVISKSIQCTGENCGGAAGSLMGSSEIINTSVNANINNPSTKTGGLVGYAAGNPKILNSNVTGSVTCGSSNGGGLVGYFDTGIISQSSFSGSISGTGPLGGLSGYARSLEIDSSFVNAYLYAMNYGGGFVGTGDEITISNSAIFVSIQAAVSGSNLGGTFATASKVTMSNCAVFADIYEAKNCSLIGTTTGNIYINNIFTDGSFNKCTGAYSVDIYPSTNYNTGVSNLYSSAYAVSKATLNYGSPKTVNYDGNRIAKFGGTELATTLNSNSSAKQWSTQTCIIPYGVTQRGMPYQIPLPNTLPSISFCH